MSLQTFSFKEESIIMNGWLKPIARMAVPTAALTYSPCPSLCLLLLNSVCVNNNFFKNQQSLKHAIFPFLIMHVYKGICPVASGVTPVVLDGFHSLDGSFSYVCIWKQEKNVWEGTLSMYLFMNYQSTVDSGRFNTSLSHYSI